MINEKYIIKKKIGEGRSKVFLCEEIDFPGKDIVIKILPSEALPKEINIFSKEYFTIRKLNHHGIIKAYDIGTIVRNDSPGSEISIGSRFITFEYFEGKTLTDFPVESENSLLEIIKRISSVLYYLHQSNYIYYDLKPENILAAEVNGLPVIKLIDLGFSIHKNDKEDVTARGTAEYIAPELLKNEEHDHRADLYSFGMLLYKIIYKKFPFKAGNELEIYKAHISDEFEFPESQFSPVLINAVKKLLSKEPSERYYTSLQLLFDLNIPVDDLKNDWIPARVFANRNDVLSRINSFVVGHEDGEVIAIRGMENAGKSSVLEKIYSKHERTVFIKNPKYSGKSSFWRMLLREVVFNSFVYPNISDELILSIFSLLKEEPANLIDLLKKIFNSITKENKFILLLDEFNRYDVLSIEIIKQLIPVFQVNKIKLIVTEDSSFPYLAEKINNLKAVNLNPFTEAQVNEYIETGLAAFFPKNEIKKIILIHADLLPGSIDSFIKDILLFNIVEFKPEGPVISTDEKKLKLLKSSQDEIYRLRLEDLSQEELAAVRNLSLFETKINDEVLSALINVTDEKINLLLNCLREKNIISAQDISMNADFTSEGLKKFIYTNIEAKNDLHLKAAEVIEKNYPSFNLIELAKQFEFAGLYYKSYEIIRKELHNAEKLSALSYKKMLLQHLLDFPLVEKDLNEIKFDLCGTLFQMGDKKASLEIALDLEGKKISKVKNLELLIIKGNCLTGTGEIEKGLYILKELLSSITDQKLKQEILFDIANAEFDLNKYSSAAEICKNIIRNPSASEETRGKSYNLLGLIDLYEKGNPDGAIEYFESALEKYRKCGMQLKVAGMELNIGNIYNMKGDSASAEQHWNEAMQINLSIGNLEQEAKLLLNYGIYFYDKLDFEKAIEKYSRADSILSSLGDKYTEGLVLINLGEVYLTTCDYQNSIELLIKAKNIFEGLKNPGEEAEALFMLGKFYYMLGDDPGLESVLNNFSKLIDQNILTGKHQNYFSLLELLIKLNENNYADFEEKMTEIKNSFLQSDDKNNFLFTSFLLCEQYINFEQYENAFNEMQNKNLLNMCRQNLFVDAQRKVFLGSIAEKAPHYIPEPSVKYFEEAYFQVEEQSITELTWKILYMLTIEYLNRGNEARANHYLLYTKYILEFISENMTDESLRLKYLEKPDRKAALEKLNHIKVLN